MSKPERADLESLSDLCTPWCLHVAVTLGIAEHIAAGHDRIEPLAAAAQCDARVLHCMLGHLVSKGVFEEPELGRFTLNDAARDLLNPAARIGLDLDGIGGRMAFAWGTLLTFVRTGASGYHEVFGRPFWEDLEAHPAVAASFDALIGAVGHGTPSAEFQISGGWDSVKTVVDVGGGTGGMLAEVLRAHLHVRGILVDVPRAVAQADEVFQSAGVADRATAVGRSFFDPLPGDADLYLLRGVLNNWPDREAAALLRNCARAAGTSGRVVILKSVGPDGEPRRLTVDMVLVGGRHRSISEFRDLARESGLEVTAAGKQSAYYVVECRVAASGGKS